VNRHVARFVFRGKQAPYLISSQPWNYTLGSDSPLERFLMLDGKIVLLGSDHHAVTFLHYVEHIADPCPLRKKRQEFCKKSAKLSGALQFSRRIAEPAISYESLPCRNEAKPILTLAFKCARQPSRSAVLL
jgi:aminoglycoside N3'-acetyltransferase